MGFIQVKKTDRTVSLQGEYGAVLRFFSDDMAGQILCYDPVAIEAMEPFWQHPEFTLDWFVGIGDAPGIWATNESYNKCRDLDTFLFADFKIPDNIYRCPWRDKCDPVNLLF